MQSSIKKIRYKSCKLCGKLFPVNGTQEYCKGPHYSTCEVCGKTFELNGFQMRKTCSRHCSSILSQRNVPTKICELCGKPFNPGSNMSRYCPGPHYSKCPVCGEEFEIKDVSQIGSCCSTKCRNAKRKQTNLGTYGFVSPHQAPEAREQFRKQSIENADRRAQTSLKRYGTVNPAQSQEVRDKIQKAILSDDFQQHKKQIMLEKYGVEYPMQDETLRKKQARGVKRKSSLELRLHAFLDEYHIKYETEYVLRSDVFTHAFDVYLPDYNLLIDCDGVFFHGYLEDPDGKWVNEDYDVLRLTCIKEGYKFLKIVESDFERGLTQLKNMLKQMDEHIFDYDSEIFKWCRSIEFPYPEYDEDRLRKEWKRLQDYETKDYNVRSNIGISLMNQFHKSIWKSHSSSAPSPYEAWYNDALLKKCILNRIIYQDTVDPSKVLQGFNVSKIAPKVSVFRPVLAKYLIEKYLADADIIRDPFAGFSGRLLGTVASGRHYIGSDIREDTLSEMKQLIDFLQINENCLVFQSDITKDDEAEIIYDAVFTCPPYNDKEHWSQDEKTLSCDEWISIVMEKCKAKKYLFVIDTTEQYKDNIVEELEDSSHFRKSKEQVVLIENR